MPYFYDNGNEYNPDLHPKPTLCVSCMKNDNPKEEIPCDLNRMNQFGEEEFICFAYEKLNKKTP